MRSSFVRRLRNRWGQVDDTTVPDLDTSGEDLWYEVEPTHDGFLTLLTDTGDVEIRLIDGDSQEEVVPVEQGAAEDGRYDFEVTAGESYVLHLSGDVESFDLRLVNLVNHSESMVDVFGTDNEDAFSFAPGTQHTVSVNGVEYGFDPSTVHDVLFDGLAGEDEAAITGTPGIDRIELSAGHGLLATRGLNVEVVDTWQIDVDGGGGPDTAVFLDSDGDDTVIADATGMTMTGTTAAGESYVNTVVNVPYTHAYARSGGHDRAELSGAAGKPDVFKASYASDNSNGQYGKLRFAGGQSRVKFFDEVVAQGDAGDRDVAVFFSTTGNDTLEAGPDSAVLTNADVIYTAIDFGVVRAYAAHGGDDTLVLTDSADDDSFRLLPGKAEARGPSYEIVARAFDHVIADATRFAEDRDEVRLYDSPEDDMLTARAGEAMMTGGVDFQAKGFQRMKAYSLHSKDLDTAVLEGGSGDDALEASSDANGLLNVRDRVDLLASTPQGIALLRACGFSEITAKSGDGNDTADVPDDPSAMDFVLRMEGDWQ